MSLDGSAPNVESACPAGFRKPLGLVLAGGGALAAWQAGFVRALFDGGIQADSVLGFSAGALTGASYALGRIAESADQWRHVDDLRVLRFSPRLSPFSLFSDDPVREAVSFARDEETARRSLRSRLIVVSLRLDDLKPAYSIFSQAGAGEWDGPLAERLTASCAIPVIFPPVRISEAGGSFVYMDGGVPGRGAVRREWMRFDALAGCRDIVVAEMVRPEEVGRRRWLPFARHDQRAREICRKQVNQGLASLAERPDPPRVFRVHPSRRLDFTMLDFKSRYCAPAVDLGLADGQSFLKEPARWVLAPSPRF